MDKTRRVDIRNELEVVNKKKESEMETGRTP